MTDPGQFHSAWLTDAGGSETPLHEGCDLGRSSKNDLVVPDPLASRRHARIQAQGQGEYWLVDFGSSNGTYVNDRRIVRPTRLHDGDRLRIGDTGYVFHQLSADDSEQTAIGAADQTLFHYRRAIAWLLVADIVGSTSLVKTLPADELPLITGRWLGLCRDAIEGAGGVINQFLGDGFFAYWPDQPGRESDVLATMAALHRQQLQAQPAFRFVLHLAPVVYGGVAIGEEERISGPDVHFVFRMEKLAGRLGASCLLSEPVMARLHSRIVAQEAGAHNLPGFPGHYRFHLWAGQG